MASRTPAALMKNSAIGTSRLAAGIAWVESPMSIASAAIARRRNGAGASSMRPCDSTAAASEPAAMPTAKMRLIAISTSMPPPMRDLMMTGSNDRVTAPTVQNQPTPSAPTHCRPSARISRMTAEGRGEDVLADLQSGRADPGRRDGARGDVAGESDQHELGGHARRRAALSRREAAEDEAADDRDEGRALDQRVAGRRAPRAEDDRAECRI